MLVLDEGEGAELCLGVVMTSLPPQCGGPRISEWDWAEHDNEYQQLGGTRWGEFVFTGLFDGATVTPRVMVPANEHDHQTRDERDPFKTSCPEPEGGWIVSSRRLGHKDLDAAFRTAHRLDDYAGSFVDTSVDSRTMKQMDTDAAAGSDDVATWIVNVAVTEDPIAAKTAIRAVWGGGVCVTAAEHTESELRRIGTEVRELPGWLSSSTGDDEVEVQVTYDDGSIQAWVDQEYGSGVVVVSSALADVT